MSDNLNENNKQSNISSGVSKISSEELSKIKDEMNKVNSPAKDEKQASEDKRGVQAKNRVSSPSENMDDMMDFVTGLLEKKKKAKAQAEAENNQETNDDNQQSEGELKSEVESNGKEISTETTASNDKMSDKDNAQNDKPDDYSSMVSSQSPNDQSASMEFDARNQISAKDKAEAAKEVPSAKELQSQTDDMVITEADGTYTSNLDFTKNKSIRRTKLPLPKLPFIIAGVAAVLVALIVGVLYIIEITRPPEPVVLLGAKLNVESIDAGYVGETIDLRGVIIECEYSDGTQKRVFDIEKYITDVSSHFVDTNPNDDKAEFNVSSAGNNGYVKFMFEGKNLELKTKTYDYQLMEISEVRIQNTAYAVGDEIPYEHVLVFVEYERLGEKLLSVDEMLLYLQVSVTTDSSVENLEKSATGFVVSNLAFGENREVIFEYQEHVYCVTLDFD